MAGDLLRDAMTTLDLPTELMTHEKFMALPDDGVERWLIRGMLREGKEMSRRGRRHSGAQANLSRHLGNWNAARPSPRGQVLAGDRAFQFGDDSDSTVGIDVAFISAELATDSPLDVYVLEGVPSLAVEILSPSDRHEETAEKIVAYLDAGVPLVWSVVPIFKTVTVYRPGHRPEIFAEGDHLDGGQHLPGLSLAVSDIFSL